jgi:hypothetical protein
MLLRITGRKQHRLWTVETSTGTHGLPSSSIRNLLDIPASFAGLLTVIGLVVENPIFCTIERNTVQEWGTQS